VPLVEEHGFLLVRVDVVCPILGEPFELEAAVVHGVVPLLQVEELSQLAAHEARRYVLTTEGGVELAPWNLVIFRQCGGVGGPPGSCRASELLGGIQSFLELCAVQ
jgi:hypothetical protein